MRGRLTGFLSRSPISAQVPTTSSGAPFRPRVKGPSPQGPMPGRQVLSPVTDSPSSYCARMISARVGWYRLHIRALYRPRADRWHRDHAEGVRSMLSWFSSTDDGRGLATRKLTRGVVAIGQVNDRRTQEAVVRRSHLEIVVLRKWSLADGDRRPRPDRGRTTASGGRVLTEAAHSFLKCSAVE